MPKCVKCGFTWVSTTRSTLQNNYYFGVIVDMLSEQTGYEFYEMHDELKAMFIMPMGYKSTTDMTTGDFKIFCKRVQEWARDNHEMNIPDPERPNEKTDQK